MLVAIRSASLFKCCIRTGVVTSGFKSLAGLVHQQLRNEALKKAYQRKMKDTSDKRLSGLQDCVCFVQLGGWSRGW